MNEPQNGWKWQKVTEMLDGRAVTSNLPELASISEGVKMETESFCYALLQRDHFIEVEDEVGGGGVGGVSDGVDGLVAGGLAGR